MDPRLCGEALTKLRKQLLAVNEDFMRHLEQLDGIDFQVRPKEVNYTGVLEVAFLQSKKTKPVNI